MAVIYWAGDSTVQYNSILTYPQTGIGQVFHLFVRPEVRIENHAKNGRSTKSFLDEGRFSVICDRIEEGDFLFIQFGHNDEKSRTLRDIRSLPVPLRQIWKGLLLPRGRRKPFRY